MSQYPMPAGSPQTWPPGSTGPIPEHSIPMFAKVMFIIDLVFSGLGALGALISIVSVVAGGQNNVVFSTPLSIGVTVLDWVVILLHITTDILGLKGDSRAAPVGFFTFALGLIVRVLGVFLLLFFPPEAQMEGLTPQVRSFVLMFGICSAILGLLYSFLWLAALIQLRNWLRQKGPTVAGSGSGMSPGGYGPLPGQMPPGQGYPGHPPGGSHFPPSPSSPQE